MSINSEQRKSVLRSAESQICCLSKRETLLFSLATFISSASEENETIPLYPEGPYFHFQPFNDDNWRIDWELSTVPNCTSQWEVEETNEPQAIPGEKRFT
jgi:hypothetical protein